MLSVRNGGKINSPATPGGDEMELTSWQRQAARQYFTDHQLAPPYDHELDALASILQYHPEPQEKKHGYGCACADCGREREDRKASDRQDCETSEMTEEAKAANRAMIAEMEQPAPELPAPFLVMDDSDDSAHGTFETWGEARGCIAYDHLSKWTIYRAGQIVESSATA